MPSDDNNLKQLQTRLNKLEEEIRLILESTQEDLRIARSLQAQLMPNRLPQITGIEAQARYISAKELSSESYDLIPVHRNRELWIIHSWTSNFGLSGVLLQTLVHMRSKQLVLESQSPEVEVVFDQLTESLCETQKKGSYRLLVAKLDLNALKLSGVAIGSVPFLKRSYSKGSLGEFSYIEAEPLLKNPKLLERALGTEPLSALRAYRFSDQLEAGSRLYLMGREWNGQASLENFAEPLKFKTLLQSSPEDTLLSNLNNLAMRIQDHIKNQKHDITVLGLELNSRLLHLA
jgi:hypothetical protein